MKQFKKTKLATAVGTAAMAMALSTPASAVVLGGDNGWEVSMTGFVNLFYNQGEFEIEGPTGATVNGLTKDEDTAHLNEGLLPNFLTFSAKSPTVNGLTGTAQFTAAYDSSQAKSTRNNKGGNSLDVREVFFNVEGSFGTISLGRTLGLFQRQAILKDMTLFGVGAFALPDQGGTTLGRIGYGYVYPEFRTRIAYKTPNVNGFQMEVGVFDPQEAFPSCVPFGAPGPYGASCANNAESDIPQFQGEVTYNTTFQGGTVGVWASGYWQEVDVNVGTRFAPIYTSEVESVGWNIGGDIAFGGFNIVGSYYDGEALGVDFKHAGVNNFNTGFGSGQGVAGLFGASGWTCGSTSCTEADNDGFYIQGSYTFGGKTKVGVSYGETNQDGSIETLGRSAAFGFNDVSHELWTVGVYHDVTSWLKLVAEYNAASQEAECGPTAVACGAPGTKINGFDFDVFSIGGFMFF